MTIRVDVHARGIIIKVNNKVEQSALGKRLRGRIPRDLILPYLGEFVLPLESAHLVALELDGEDVVWSDDAWRHVLNQRDIIAHIDASKIEVGEALASPRESLKDYPLLEVLDEHQIEAVAAMTVPSLVGLALFDEQGLGKTYMALCTFDRLRQIKRIERLLVLAPKSVVTSWSNDIKKLFGDKYIVRIVGGSKLERRRRIRSRFDILLCNYESAVSELDLIKRTIRNMDSRFMLVVDESFFIKNPNAKRSQATSEIRSLCDRGIVLSGTPAPNSSEDIINQMDVTYAGHFSANKKIPKEKNEVKEFVSSSLDNLIYLRRLKEEVLPDIPDKWLDKVSFDLSPIQRSLYEKARHELVLAVRSVDDHEFLRDLGSFLARRSALLQICSHPGAIDPLYHETPAKLLALDRLLQELVIEQDKKVVIWSFFRYSLQAIADRFQNYGLVRIDGSIPSFKERKEAIRKFQEDDNIRIFLGNAAAAGAGITLTAAHHAIYESFSNQAVHYMQSIDRIHRRGQTQKVTGHILLTKKTVESGEFDRILEKERAGRDLLGDSYKELITRDRFLVDLGASDV